MEVPAPCSHLAFSPKIFMQKAIDAQKASAETDKAASLRAAETRFAAAEEALRQDMQVSAACDGFRLALHLYQRLSMPSLFFFFSFFLFSGATVKSTCCSFASGTSMQRLLELVKSTIINKGKNFSAGPFSNP